MKFNELYQKAKSLAHEKHKNQRYSNNQPYTVHLQAVEAVLRRFGYSPDLTERNQNLIIGAWLHDIIEDTDATYQMIELEFGKEIAELVHAVTNEPGMNRKERHEKTYPKIKNHTYAIILKLADRIANVEESVKSKSTLLGMYRKEWKEFKVKLQNNGECQEMWDFLDKILS